MPSDAEPVKPDKSDFEPCPDCTMERSKLSPEDDDWYHASTCPRVNTKGQIGPPWKPGPWGSW